MNRNVRRVLMGVVGCIAMLASLPGCGDGAKTEIPKDMKEVPKLTPASGGGDGKAKAANPTGTAN